MISIHPKNIWRLLSKNFDYNKTVSLCILFIAISILGEYFNYYDSFIKYRNYDYILCTVFAALVVLRALIKGVDQWFSLFIIAMVYVAFIDFRDTPNHVFFSLFLLLPAAIFHDKISSVTYSDFVRRTLGIVMVAAASQKVISGNYLNGDFLKFLSSGQGSIESLLGTVCFDQPMPECDALVYISILTVIWQYAIGILLLINCRHILAFLAEIIFLLGIGFITDEMNFQTVNIVALIIAFRLRSSLIIFIGLILFLLYDLWRIDGFLEALLL